MRVFITVLDELALEDNGFRLLDLERRAVSATRTSSGILSAMEAIQVLGRGEMSVLHLIPSVSVRKIPNIA
jgi:hypothetical protein